jgi:hypothetical protein
MRVSKSSHAVKTSLRGLPVPFVFLSFIVYEASYSFSDFDNKMPVKTLNRACERFETVS